MSPPLIPAEVLREATTHLMARYPEEGCGVLLRKGTRWRFAPMTNAATRFHRADPASFPRDARTAYLFDPREQRELWARAGQEGWEIAAIAHSHCDEPAEFSEMDRELAMAAEGEVLHPGVAYLVVAVYGGEAREARIFAWRDGRWLGRDVSL